MDTLELDPGSSVTMEITASFQYTMSKPALPGRVKVPFIGKGHLSWEQTEEFSSVRQSPAQEVMKVGMFGQGVSMPMTVLAEHPKE